jgi:hypothetical protein
MGGLLGNLTHLCSIFGQSYRHLKIIIGVIALA